MKDITSKELLKLTKKELVEKCKEIGLEADFDDLSKLEIANKYIHFKPANEPVEEPKEEPVVEVDPAVVLAEKARKRAAILRELRFRQNKANTANSFERELARRKGTALNPKTMLEELKERKAKFTKV